jgi:allantoinase
MSSTGVANQGIPPSSLIVVTSSRVVLDEDQDAAPATIEISASTGKFISIHARHSTADEYPPAAQFLDYGNLVIMPGLVDAHVHIDEPYCLSG